jgi:Kdo2-lipid IVA lauroyltransferase/acyltransferase
MNAALTYFFIYVCRAISYLPRSIVAALSDAIGWLLWLLAAPRRKIALKNLELCFPDWPAEKRTRIAKAHFNVFVRSFFDRFALWHHSEKAIKALVELRGLDVFQKHLGRPMILLAPHFLGMDAGGMRLQMEASMASMYAKQKNEVFNDEMNQGRMRFNGATMLLRTDGIRPALRLIKQGTPFYFLPDMDLGDRDALFVPFFGVPAATVSSMARLAAATKAVVIPIVTHLTRNGYVTTLHPAWEDYPGDDIEAATLRMNQFIEQEVLKFPEQYLWTHKRFKTRPPGATSFYE